MFGPLPGEIKQREQKHHAWSDTARFPHLITDQKLAEKLQAEENLKAFNQRFPPARVNNPAPVINIPPPIINLPAQPSNQAELQALQDRLNKVEKEDKEMQERIKNALILDNPRLLQAFYPSARPLYNPISLVDAAILNEVSKKEQLDQTYRKLKDLYGDEAPTRYLLRSLNRIEEEKPKPFELPTRDEPKSKPRPRSRSKSKSKKKSKPKSPSKKKK